MHVSGLNLHRAFFISILFKTVLLASVAVIWIEVKKSSDPGNEWNGLAVSAPIGEERVR
jgi:hypothetical protein